MNGDPYRRRASITPLSVRCCTMRFAKLVCVAVYIEPAGYCEKASVGVSRSSSTSDRMNNPKLLMLLRCPGDARLVPCPALEEHLLERAEVVRRQLPVAPGRCRAKCSSWSRVS